MNKFEVTVKYELLFCLLIAFAILSIYSQVINHEFVLWDDPLYISENPHVQQGLSSEGLKWAFGSENRVETWHPLTWLFHMANYDMFGNQSGLHLLINSFWHILNTCLLFLLLHRMTGVVWSGIIVASIFAVHPLNVETVAWASELKNLISTFFLLLSLLVYYFYASNPSFMKYILLVLVFAAGLLAKPMLVTLPFIFLLLDYWPLERISSNFVTTDKQKSLPTWISVQLAPRILEKIPLIFLAFLVWYLVSKTLSDLLNFIPLSAVPLSLRIENLFVSFASYFFKSIWPDNLVFYYPFPQSLSISQVTGSVFLLATITFIFLVPLRGRKYLTVGWLWFIGTLIPVSGLIQAGLWPAMADRYAYVPYIGLYIIFAESIQEILARRRYKQLWLISVTIFIIAAYGAISWRQVQNWKNSENLFRYALSVNYNNAVAHNNLCDTLARKGQTLEAIKYCKATLDINPRKDDARSTLVRLLTKLGKTEEADRVYQEGVQLKPNTFKINVNSSANSSKISRIEDTTLNREKYLLDKDSDSHFRKAKELTERGQLEDAIEQYLKFVAINPDHYESQNNLGVLFSQTGKIDSAILHFKKALIIAPDNAETHFNLAYTLSAADRLDDAEVYFKRALEINPNFVTAYINYGVLLAQQARSEEAIRLFSQALHLDPSSIDGHVNMGVALIHLGKKDEAVHHFQQAVKLNPEDLRLQKLLERANRF